MPANDIVIGLRLTADSSGFTGQVRLARRELDKFSGAANAGIRGIVRTIGNFETLRAQLRAVTGDADIAAREFDRVAQFAANTPLSVQELVRAYSQLSAVGVDASNDTLTALGNIGSVFNDFGGLVTAVLSREAETFKRFGIIVRQEGDDINVTYKGVTQTVENSSAGLVRALKEISRANFSTGLEDQANTLYGAFSNFGDTLDHLADQFGQGGFSEALNGLTRGMTATFDSLSGVARGLGAVAGATVDLIPILAAGGLGNVLARLAKGLSTSTAEMRLQARQSTVLARAKRILLATELSAAQQSLATATTRRAKATATIQVAAAENRYQAALTASNSASLAAAATTSRLAATRVLAIRAFTAITGPIGLVTTALTLGATAWTIWGRTKDDALADIESDDLQLQRIESALTSLQPGPNAQGYLSQTQERLREVRRLGSDIAEALGKIENAYKTSPRGITPTIQNDISNLRSLLEEAGVRADTKSLGELKDAAQDIIVQLGKDAERLTGFEEGFLEILLRPASAESPLSAVSASIASQGNEIQGLIEGLNTEIAELTLEPLDLIVFNRDAALSEVDAIVMAHQDSLSAIAAQREGATAEQLAELNAREAQITTDLARAEKSRADIRRKYGLEWLAEFDRQYDEQIATEKQAQEQQVANVKQVTDAINAQYNRLDLVSPYEKSTSASQQWYDELKALIQKLDLDWNEYSDAAERGLAAGQMLEEAQRAEQARRDRIDGLRASENPLDGIRLGLENFADQSQSTAETFAESFSTALEGSAGLFADWATGAIENTEDLKAAFADLANDIIRQLIRIAIQEALVRSIAALVPVGGGVGGDGRGGIGPNGFIAQQSAAKYNISPTQHTGGIAGQLGGIRRSGVNPAVFAGAPRYHRGGIAGDEVPTILQRGEGVFTREQMAALGPQQAPMVTVNIINQGTSQRQQGQPRTRQDAERTIIDVVVTDIGQNGAIADAVRGAGNL